jgi:hypothetical protein
MKAVVLFLWAAGLLLAGCNKDKPSPDGQTGPSSGGNPLTAPADYLDAAARAKQSATKTVSGAGLDQAIKLFYTENGKFPRELKELTPQYLPQIPPPPAGMRYDYDPSAGTFKVVPQ